MNRRVLSGALSLFVVANASTSALALTAPRDGSVNPVATRVMSKDADAYRNRHAWVEKARAAKEAREAEAGRPGFASLSTPLPADLAVTGTMNVPVLLGYFNNQSAPTSPITQAQIQTQLFGANPTGSVSDYYTEVSYGQFTIAGTVYGWTQLSQNNPYYAGATQGLEPGDARTGNLIKELLDARDGAVNFGLYDNDGPDGVPNSGDDDGFVDVLCVMHSFRGAECGLTANIQSHSWRYSAWPVSGGAPYTTNDARFGGGFIKVDDYDITPALSCNTPNEIIEIGTLCHELGHGLGLPDLYGIDPATGGLTGDKGAGDWSIMASGNWNTPDTPAHFDAWCKKELGWLVPTEINWQPTLASLPAIESTATAFKLPFTDERFRRSTACAINGSYSLYCGLPVAEGTARGWASPGPTAGIRQQLVSDRRTRLHVQRIGTGHVPVHVHVRPRARLRFRVRDRRSQRRRDGTASAHRDGRRDGRRSAGHRAVSARRRGRHLHAEIPRDQRRLLRRCRRRRSVDVRRLRGRQHKCHRRR